MTSDSNRKRAVRKIQAEQGIKYTQALRIWEAQKVDREAQKAEREKEESR